MDFFNFGKKFRKGSPSKTRKGRLDFTTKKGSKYYQTKGHRVKKGHRPYSYHKGSLSKTHLGDLDFTTKLGSKYYQTKGRRVKKSKKPYTRFSLFN